MEISGLDLLPHCGPQTKRSKGSLKSLGTLFTLDHSSEWKDQIKDFSLGSMVMKLSWCDEDVRK